MSLLENITKARLVLVQLEELSKEIEQNGLELDRKSPLPSNNDIHSTVDGVTASGNTDALVKDGCIGSRNETGFSIDLLQQRENMNACQTENNFPSNQVQYTPIECKSDHSSNEPPSTSRDQRGVGLRVSFHENVNHAPEISAEAKSFPLKRDVLGKEPPIEQHAGLTWQSNEHFIHRRGVVKAIAQMLVTRKSNPSRKWMTELPSKARKLEDRLYRSSLSFEEYMDTKTLKSRLMKVAKGITLKHRNARRSIYNQTQSGQNTCSNYMHDSRLLSNHLTGREDMTTVLPSDIIAQNIHSHSLGIIQDASNSSNIQNKSFYDSSRVTSLSQNQVEQDRKHQIQDELIQTQYPQQNIPHLNMEQTVGDKTPDGPLLAGSIAPPLNKANDVDPLLIHNMTETDLTMEECNFFFDPLDDSNTGDLNSSFDQPDRIETEFLSPNNDNLDSGKLPKDEPFFDMLVKSLE